MPLPANKWTYLYIVSSLCYVCIGICFSFNYCSNYRCHNMGFACKWVRQKTRRDHDRDQDPNQNQTVLNRSRVDRSSDFLRAPNRRQQRNKDRYTSQTINQLARKKTTITNFQPKNDANDNDISFKSVDDENMAEICTITNSIPTNRCKSLTPFLDHLKCGLDSERFKVNVEHRMNYSSTNTIVCRCKCNEIMFKLRAMFAAPFDFDGDNRISQLIHMINFKRKINQHHPICTLPQPLPPPPPSYTERIETITPTKLATKIDTATHQDNNNNYSTKTKSANKNTTEYGRNKSNSVHNKSDQTKRIYNKGHNNRSIITSSQCFIRQSVCLYAASGFLIALCFLAIPAAASIDSLHPM